MAKKKVVKKVGEILEEKIVDQESAIDAVVDQMTQAEVEEFIDASKAVAPAQVQADAGEEMVKVTIPVYLKIKKTTYQPGTHRVPKHLVPQILEMVHKKRAADLSMFTGKNYLIQRLLDRTLVVREVESLDLKKMTK